MIDGRHFGLQCYLFGGNQSKNLGLVIRQFKLSYLNYLTTPTMPSFRLAERTVFNNGYLHCHSQDYQPGESGCGQCIALRQILHRAMCVVPAS